LRVIPWSHITIRGHSEIEKKEEQPSSVKARLQRIIQLSMRSEGCRSIEVLLYDEKKEPDVKEATGKINKHRKSFSWAS
jgi:hypothetical protein